MSGRKQTRLVALMALLALVTVLVAPAPHDHLGKAGSVCHVCSAAQPAALTADPLLIGPALRLVGVLASTEQLFAAARYESQKIPRAPPA